LRDISDVMLNKDISYVIYIRGKSVHYLHGGMVEGQVLSKRKEKFGYKNVLLNKVLLYW